ncbi:MAG: hypothetical protein ABI333_29705 [bacterium]
MGVKRWSVTCATLLVVGGAACGEDAPPIHHPERFTVWAEFLELGDVDEWLGWAGAHGLNVNVAITEDVHDRAFLAAVCGAAQQHDVALRLWPLLTQDKGYWANQANVEDFARYVGLLRDWAEADCPRLEGFVVDLEMPYDRAQEMQALFDTGGSTGDLLNFLLLGVDEDAFEAARGRFVDLVEDLNGRGYLVSASTLAFLADDPGDGDESIAKALWTPINDIPWEKISFQVYRTHFQQIWGQGIAEAPVDFPPGLITSYARSIVEYYGERGAIDLGTIGSAGVGGINGYTDAADLQADIAAALAEGIPTGRIQLFSLDGLFEVTHPTDFVTIPTPAAAPIDASTLEMRNLFTSLDLIAN